MKKIRKIFKYLFCILFLFIIILTSFLYCALNTEDGYKNTFALISKFSPIKLEYQHLEGKFFGKQRIKNLIVKLDNKNIFQAEDLELYINLTDVFDKKIAVEKLLVKNSVLNLPEAKDKEKEKSKPLKKLPEINLPFLIEVKNIEIDNFSIPEINFYLNKFNTEAKLDKSLANLKADADLALDKIKIRTDLKAQIDLKKDYPLELLANSKINIEKDNLDIGLALLGSALKPELKIISEGLVKGEIISIADISLEKQFLKLSSEIKNVKYQDYSLDNLALIVEGKFNELFVNLTSQFGDNKIIPQSELQSSLLITPDSLKGISLNLKSLGGEIKLFANLNFSPLAWNSEIRIFNILGKNYPQIKEIENLKLSGEILSSGVIDDKIKIKTEIKNLAAKYLDLELNSNGILNLEDKNISAQDFIFNFAGNKIKINGELKENAAINLDINASNLKKISKIIGLNLSGEIIGNLVAEGNYLNPILKGKIDWKNFNFNDLVSSKNGSLNLDGDLENLKTELKTVLSGKNIPPLNAQISADLAVLKGINNLKANLKILDGNLNLGGKASWENGIAWDISLKSESINPQFFADALKGKINANLISQGKIEGKTLNINNELKSLDGNFLGYKLAGTGKVKIIGEKVELNNLNLALGDNKLSANGEISPQTINIKAQTNLANLSAIYKDLGGSLSGNLSASGKISSPAISADLNLNSFRFLDNRINSGKIKLNSGFSANSPFTNRIEINGLSVAGGLSWQNIVLTTEGGFSSHRISFKTTGGDYNINEFSASGGFKGFEAWNGTLNALGLDIEGIKLRTRTSAAISASAKNISLKNFCLVESVNTDLCLNLTHNNKTNLDFVITKLSPKSFTKFIPKEIKINNQISGRGNLTINSNKTISGSANLTISSGKIVVNSGSPLVFNLQKGGIVANFSGNQIRAKALIDLGKSGNLNAEADLANMFTNPTINAKALITIADIGVYKYLAPQLSVLQGSLRGQLAVGGSLKNPSIGGDILLSNGRVVVPQFSTDLNNIRIALQSGKDGNFHINGNIGTAEGALKASGILKIVPLTLELKLSGKRMLVANSKEMQVYVSPDFDISINPKDGLNVKGQVLIPEAKISIPDVNGSVAISEDVVIKSKKNKYHKNGKKVQSQSVENETNMPTKIRIAIVLGDKVFFKNADMNIRLLGKLNIWLRNGQPRGVGRVEVAEGTYEVYGQELIIQRGSATFSGEISNPTLDILAMRDVGDVSAGAKISGTVKNMKLELTSDPIMPDASILSYLITGRAPDSSSDSTALLQTAVAMGTRAVLSSDLADKTGLDVFDVNIAGLKAGKYLGQNIYVGMKSDFFKAITTFLARYKINKRLSIEGSSSTKDGNAVDLLYEWESKK